MWCGEPIKYFRSYACVFGYIEEFCRMFFVEGRCCEDSSFVCLRGDQ